MSTAPRPWLFCFHHAGAGISSFARWQGVVGDAADVVPVLLPGRGSRVREARITDPGQLLGEIEELIGPMLDRPYLLYGHSLGGLVAYTFARTRAAAGSEPPALVAVGAVLPPHLRSPVLRSAALPDPELLELLVAYGALPPEALDDPGLWCRRVVPALRDDLRLGQALCEAAGPGLPVPLLALSGRHDPIAPTAGMAEWAGYATGGFRLRTVPGDHYFVRGGTAPRMLREAAARLRARTLRPESSRV
ncbi:thioesterase domain-containing protein [Streptacidiphilus sp. ASG 303]|uniref:thioesterase II family protein n=1 Tax=Streptacidiphilus sp. ASG 303 TaxID=2896847 RepID=UPI001E333914|nr:alpha/beta fold hydrolase [Streptacidiphilus sp. ASG 303]MCD0486344.1 thioesterase domain-containing protein [Streptacidiphilus sp. ASG 303]